MLLKIVFVYIFVNTWDSEGHPTYSREPTKLSGHVRIFMSGPRNIYERFMNETNSTRLAHNFFYEQVASKIVRTFYEHIMSKVRVSESEKKEG